MTRENFPNLRRLELPHQAVGDLNRLVFDRDLYGLEIEYKINYYSDEQYLGQQSSRFYSTLRSNHPALNNTLTKMRPSKIQISFFNPEQDYSFDSNVRTFGATINNNEDGIKFRDQTRNLSHFELNNVSLSDSYFDWVTRKIIIYEYCFILHQIYISPYFQTIL